MNKTRISNTPKITKRMALYARVSTQEQTKGQYPSCESQIEEMEAACLAKGWRVQEIIKDEGISAGSLKRPGLSHMRWLVESGQIDGVICTWYDRLVRTRDFYVLDNEFNRHNIEFITLHDPTDRHTASGRFLETMLVAAKTYEREQTGEKVRTKMRMRAEKGMGNGGPIPFGFHRDARTQLVLPDKKITPIVQQMFEIYTQTQSDCKVRDWLQAHHIAAAGGKKQWVTSSIRYLLMNRRYIAETEINRHNKGIEGLPESEAYRVIPAQYETVIPRELFDLAQSIRATNAERSASRGGRGKGNNYSLNQCQRVYLMQGSIVCGICGAAMSPHYVYHKPNEKEKRRTASYIYHYTCAQKMKYRQTINHSNRVLARVAESWVLDAIECLATDKNLVNRALEVSWEKSAADLRPTRDAFTECQRALNENQRQINELLETATNARGALLELFNEKAHALKLQRENLKIESRALNERMAPLNHNFDADKFLYVLNDFNLMREKADPLKLQQLLRLIVRKVEWMPDNEHRVQYYMFDSPRRDKLDGSSDGLLTGSRPELDGPLFSGCISTVLMIEDARVLVRPFAHMEPSSIREPVGALSSSVRREALVAFLALGVLGAVCALAFCAPSEKVVLSDQIALLFLALAAALLWWPGLLHKLEDQPGAATFCLTAAMFVIYSLARRVVPENGWSLRFAALPDDEYIFPFSAYLVTLGALLTSPLWWRSGSTWTRALLFGLGIVASFSLFSFCLLARFYPVGAAQRLDPSSLPNLFLLLVEYGCVALLCRAACVNVRARRLALRVLPLLLFALWARFHFIKARDEDAA